MSRSGNVGVCLTMMAKFYIRLVIWCNLHLKRANMIGYLISSIKINFLSRFRVVDDIRVRVIEGKTLDELAEVRSSTYLMSYTVLLDGILSVIAWICFPGGLKMLTNELKKVHCLYVLEQSLAVVLFSDAKCKVYVGHLAI